MADGNLGDVKVRFSADTKDVEKGLNDIQGKTSKASSGITSAFKGVGLAVAGAFSVAAIGDFLADSVKLAGQAQGVKQAFDRISGASIEKLRASVRGTVSDLDLMKSAVQANNFKIPVEQLGKLFEFAQKRAAQTGESVDYLTQSIVLGIGRKSPLILDNLGISAVELREKLNGVGVEAATIGDVSKIVGDIATDELKKMGDVALTTADRMAQVAAETENLKVEIGNRLTPAMNVFYGAVNDTLKALEALMETAGDKGRAGGLAIWENIARDGREASLIVEEYTAKIGTLYKTQASLQAKMKQAEEIGRTDTAYYDDLHDQLQNANAKVQVLEQSYRKWAEATYGTKKETDSLNGSMSGLMAHVEELQKMQLDAPIAEWQKWQREIDKVAAKIDAIKNPARAKQEQVSDLQTPGIPTIFGNVGIGVIDPLKDVQPDKLKELTAMTQEQAWALEMAAGFAADLGQSFASAIVNGENLGEALGEVFKQVLQQLIAVVVQALVLTAIMAALTGGSSLAGGFGAAFKNNLLGGGGGMQLGGFIRGEDIFLSGQRGNTNTRR